MIDAGSYLLSWNKNPRATEALRKLTLKRGICLLKNTQHQILKLGFSKAEDEGAKERNSKREP